jgi:hypothetical protein
VGVGGRCCYCVLPVLSGYSVLRTASSPIAGSAKRFRSSEGGSRSRGLGAGRGARGVWRWRRFAVRQDGDRHTAVRITHHRPRTGRHSTNMAYCIWHNARQAGRHGGCPVMPPCPCPFCPCLLPPPPPSSVVRRRPGPGRPPPPPTAAHPAARAHAPAPHARRRRRALGSLSTGLFRRPAHAPRARAPRRAAGGYRPMACASSVASCLFPEGFSKEVAVGCAIPPSLPVSRCHMAYSA